MKMVVSSLRCVKASTTIPCKKQFPGVQEIVANRSTALYGNSTIDESVNDTKKLSGTILAENVKLFVLTQHHQPRKCSQEATQRHAVKSKGMRCPTRTWSSGQTWVVAEHTCVTVAAQQNNSSASPP
jgi:hypothetical protein